jgi:glycosyltransferase involved in cell wall biosynthesis
VNVLFIHQNFPGQFVHLAAALAQESGNRVVALAQRVAPAPVGVEVRVCAPLRERAEEVHPLLGEEEIKVMRAEAVAAAALVLRREGFTPDVIVAHPGWGDALFIKDVYPHAKLVVYCEFYYSATGQDVGFDPEMPKLSFEHQCRLRLRNSVNLQSLAVADAAVSPTEWQRSTFPAAFRPMIQVIHDGIDVESWQRVQPRPIELANAAGERITVRPGERVFTYVARALEPVRGFHTFMRALPRLQELEPRARVVIVGRDKVSYGSPPPDGGTWREKMLAELDGQLDLRRIAFTGTLPYQQYQQLMRISSAHTYLTTPFVLSWSLLEAAFSGVAVIASDTPPVLEFADRLRIATTSFFDHAALANHISRLGRHRPAARPTCDARLEVQSCVQEQVQLLRAA